MRKTLDKTRPFGVVYGDDKAAYHQDNIYFNAQGIALTESAEVPAAAPAQNDAPADTGGDVDPALAEVTGEAEAKPRPAKKPAGRGGRKGG